MAALERARAPTGGEKGKERKGRGKGRGGEGGELEHQQAQLKPLEGESRGGSKEVGKVAPIGHDEFRDGLVRQSVANGYIFQAMTYYGTGWGLLRVFVLLFMWLRPCNAGSATGSQRRI